MKEVYIKERYSKTSPTNRRIDFLLISSNGYVGILEIKKPFESCILMSGLYCQNYIPKRELSGAIMQAEKYIYYLNSLNTKEEIELTKQYKTQLPKNVSIKIRNPKALVLLGRSNGFNQEQETDFEFIKRKYVNITDILTYDDLLNRIENITDSLIKRKS